MPLLEVVDLACRRGGRPVFERVSFVLGAGDLLALTGPNGSGKTTLLRALAGLARLHAGTVRWRGGDRDADPDSWRSCLAWLGHLDGLKGDLTIRENLENAARLTGRGLAAIAPALGAYDLVTLAGRPVRTLSAGQRRRTALARLVAARAALWLLDEPLNALDMLAQEAFRAALAEHLAGGGIAIAATHADLGVPAARRLDLGSHRTASLSEAPR